MEEGFTVRCLARSPEKLEELAKGGCEILKGDFTDSKSVEHALESIDAVYVSIHTLAPQQKSTAELGFMDIEMNALQNIVAGCKLHHVTRLIYVTSLGISADATNAWNGLPPVSYLAEQLHISPDYLSGLLKSLTGMTTQQHIHEKLIEKAKQQLSATNLSVSEIAYQLGFEHSQSFSKLFKAKTDLSPLAFRAKFN